MTWYAAAAYCNWLSEQEGIPPDQWCYKPNKEGKYDQGMEMAADYLQRTGYRLPTEAEWEFACRAGATTRFSFGESEELLPRYAWYQKNGQNKSWPVGNLKPNDLGLFDMHGNNWEWCQNAYKPYDDRGDGKATEDLEDTSDITNSNNRVLRNAQFDGVASFDRSARRSGHAPADQSVYHWGFRPARTLSFRSFDRYAAARAAALAAAGNDKEKLDEAAKAKLRQALGWLKAELAYWNKVQPPRLLIARNLWLWQHDRDLAGIRDQAALARLPAEERKAFTQFWAVIAKTAEPANSAERLDFARVAVLIAAGQGKDEPPFDDTAKANLRRQAFDWLKAELNVSADRAIKARIVAAAAPLPGLLEKLVESAPDDGQLQAELGRHHAEQGNHPLADAARTKARALFEMQLAKEPENTALAAELADLLLIDATRWTVLTPVEMSTETGARMELQKDGSVFVHRPNNNDTYTLTFRTEMKGIKGLRLEVLADARLPYGGPGWTTEDGNFVLSKLSLQAAPARSPEQPRSIALRSAWADFSQKDWDVRGIVDDKVSKGWAVQPEINKDHTAIFETAEEVGDGQATRLTVRLDQHGPHKDNLLGRFRLSVSDDPAAVEREQKRFAAKEFTDPWLKLAAAYALNGRNDKAAEYLGKAIQRADGRAGKARLIAAAAPLEAVLEKLAESAPNDGPFQAELARHFAERGNKPLANAARTKAHALFEKELAREPENSVLSAELADLLLLGTKHWTVLQPTGMTSKGGANLTLQPDGSVLASGNNPNNDVYDIKAEYQGRIGAIRLEAIPDRSMPSGGSGRAPTWGNFVLTDFRVVVGERVVTWGRADADFSQERQFNQVRKFPIDYAIDTDESTGWAIYPRVTVPHWAVFIPSQPVDAASKTQLTIRLAFGSKDMLKYNLGRFRLSVSDDSAAFEREQKRFALLKVTDPWLKLADAYAENGRNDKAAEYYRKALQADPKLGDDPQAQHRYHAARAAVLAAAGQGKDEPLLDDEARAKLRGQALDWLKAELTDWSKVQPPPRQEIVRNLWQWQQDGALASIRDQAALDKLPPNEQNAFTQLWADVAKSAEPANDAERLQCAEAAYERKLYALATRLWAAALANDPKLGDDPQAQHRYHAARAAALVAAGQGKDVPPLDDAAKAKLRGQALDWLKAELIARSKLLDSGPLQDRPAIVQTLLDWQKDSDLAGIRDKTALARLPEEEQKRFAQLWVDVDTLLSLESAAPPLIKSAALHAWFGQDKELAATCDQGLNFVKETKDPTKAERVAKVCSLRPSDSKTHEAALVLARRAVELGKGHPYLAYFQMTLGMAEYRSGHYAAADAALIAASQLGNNNYIVSVTAAYYRAMSLYRQGKEAEAAQTVGRSRCPNEAAARR